MAHIDRDDASLRHQSAQVFNYNLSKCRKVIADLNSRISRYSSSDRFYEEYELALYEYFEGRGECCDDDEEQFEYFQSEQEYARFMAWYSLYFVTDEHGKTFPWLYLQRKKNQLSSLEREVLQSYVDSCLTVYEVQRVDPGKGVEVKEIFTNRTCYVWDAYISRGLFKWDLLYAGLVEVRGLTFFGGLDPTVIPPKLKQFVEENIQQIFQEDKENYATFRDFLKEDSTEIYALLDRAVTTVQNPLDQLKPGEEMICMTTLHYDVKNREALLEALGKSPVFSECGRQPGRFDNREDGLFYWLFKGVHRSNGHSDAPGILRVGQESLVAESTSRQFARSLQLLLDRMFGPFVEYRMTVYKNVPKNIEPSLPRPPISRECADSLSEMAESEPVPGVRIYDNWVHEKLSDIGNITPLEAIKTAEGKEKLINILKEYENQNERAIRRSRKNVDVPVFPVEKIKKELGL
jgi:hypothetical protein